MLVMLAIETGIPTSEWTDADEIYTAFELLKERNGTRTNDGS